MNYDYDGPRSLRINNRQAHIRIKPIRKIIQKKQNYSIYTEGRRKYGTCDHARQANAAAHTIPADEGEPYHDLVMDQLRHRSHIKTGPYACTIPPSIVGITLSLKEPCKYNHETHHKNCKFERNFDRKQQKNEKERFNLLN